MMMIVFMVNGQDDNDYQGHDNQNDDNRGHYDQIDDDYGQDDDSSTG